MFEESDENIEEDFQILLEDPIKIEYGDIYKLGDHFLMCGDSTKINDVDMLLNNNKIDLLFTDPPYNVSFNGRSGNFDVMLNDNLSENDFEIFIDKFIEIVKIIKIETYYIWCNWKFYGLLQSKLQFTSCIVWAKNVFGMGVGYRHQHEFCLFNGKIKENIKNETDLWKISKDVNYIHSTQKPLELAIRAIKNHDAKNILDLFGGSGTTLIASEYLNKKCFMMELDPKYVSLIIKRWEKLTRKKAIKVNINIFDI